MQRGEKVTSDFQNNAESKGGSSATHVGGKCKLDDINPATQSGEEKPSRRGTTAFEMGGRSKSNNTIPQGRVSVRIPKNTPKKKNKRDCGTPNCRDQERIKPYVSGMPS